MINYEGIYYYRTFNEMLILIKKNILLVNITITCHVLSALHLGIFSALMNAIVFSHKEQGVKEMQTVPFFQFC